MTEVNELSVSTWADETFLPLLKQRRFTGAVVTVVQGDRVLLSKGYGTIGGAGTDPVNPNTTRFLVASITKTFTATAVAQLQDQNKIHTLDDPANKYLKRYKLPDAEGGPITIRDLLTQRAGFEGKQFGIGAESKQVSRATEAIIRRFQPKIVRPRDKTSVYSNFGIAILGTLIEDVTGVPLADYFQEHITRPLGMSATRLNYESAPGPLLARPIVRFPNGTTQPARFLGFHPFMAPAASLETTGGDMARYMAAQLAEGTGPSPILSSAGFAQLHTRTRGNHPAVGGFSMGFVVNNHAGQKLLEHPGQWPGYASMMSLVMGPKIGLFMSVAAADPSIGLVQSITGSARLKPNSIPAAAPSLDASRIIRIRTAFLTRFIGPALPAPQPTTVLDGTGFAGEYLSAHRSQTTVESILSFLDGPIRVERHGPDFEISGWGRYRQVARDILWRSPGADVLGKPEGAPDLIAILRDKSGRPIGLSDSFGFPYYERAKGLLPPSLPPSLLTFAVLGGLTGLLCLFWPWSNKWERFARYLPLMLAFLTIAAPLPLLVAYPEGENLEYAILAGDRARLALIVMFANLAAIIALAIALFAFLAWRQSYWGVGKRAVARRIHFTLIACLGLGVIIALSSMNAVGAKLP